MDAPFGIPESWEEHARLMFELAALAYQADITRVLSYMMAKDASMISHTNLGISEPHHSTTHHLELPESIPNLVKINTYHMSLSPSSSSGSAPRPTATARAGSLTDPVRQRDERGEHAFPAQHPHAAGRWSSVGFKGNRHIQTAAGDAVCQLPAVARQRSGWVLSSASGR